MAEATFRIPSKAVQYGYVEIPFTFDSAPDAEMLAAHYVNYVYAFQKEEQEAIKRLQQNPVAAPVAASQPVTEEQAQRYLDEGLGGVSKVEEYEDNTESAAPWDAPAPRVKKPWEVDGITGPAILDALGDGW